MVGIGVFRFERKIGMKVAADRCCCWMAWFLSSFIDSSFVLGPQPMDLDSSHDAVAYQNSLPSCLDENAVHSGEFLLLMDLSTTSLGLAGYKTAIGSIEYGSFPVRP